MSDLEFTDTHVHFYDLRDPGLHYSWLVPDAEEDPGLGNHDALKAVRYWADDFIAESRFAGTTKAVHVQAAIGIEDPVGGDPLRAGVRRPPGVPAHHRRLLRSDRRRCRARDRASPGVSGGVRDPRPALRRLSDRPALGARLRAAGAARAGLLRRPAGAGHGRRCGAGEALLRHHLLHRPRRLPAGGAMPSTSRRGSAACARSPPSTTP